MQFLTWLLQLYTPLASQECDWFCSRRAPGSVTLASIGLEFTAQRIASLDLQTVKQKHQSLSLRDLVCHHFAEVPGDPLSGFSVAAARIQHITPIGVEYVEFLLA